MGDHHLCRQKDCLLPVRVFKFDFINWLNTDGQLYVASFPGSGFMRPATETAPQITVIVVIIIV